MRFEKGHTPANKGGGKKIDAELFMENFSLYVNGEINQKIFSKNLGLSCPTLHKHLKELVKKGYIDGVFFTDGKPMIMGYYGFSRGEDTPKTEAPKTESEGKKVIYPRLV